MLLFAPSFGGLSGGLGAVNSDVLALQAALTKLGKNVGSSGLMNDATFAALWEVISADANKLKVILTSLDSTAGSAVGWLADSMNWVDAQVKKVPLGLLTTKRVLDNWANINSVAYGVCMGASYTGAVNESTCTSISQALYNARQTIFDGTTKIAGPLTKVIAAFGGTPATGPAMTAKEKLLASLKMPAVNIQPKLSYTPSPVGVITPTITMPTASKVIWAVLGLVGGVLLATRAA